MKRAALICQRPGRLLLIQLRHRSASFLQAGQSNLPLRVVGPFRYLRCRMNSSDHALHVLSD